MNRDETDLTTALVIGVETGVITRDTAKRIIAELRKALKRSK